MPKFPIPTGHSNGAMMHMHMDTRTHTDTGTRRQKEQVGTGNKIRVGENGTRSRAAMSISHEAAGIVFLCIMLLVIVFTQAGGHGIKPGLNATDYKQIGVVHVENDMTHWNEHTMDSTCAKYNINPFANDPVLSRYSGTVLALWIL